MRLRLRADLGGYAVEALAETTVDGTVLDRPFVLLTGPNGSGKSAIMRAMRATIGLRGERQGRLNVPHRRRVDPADGDLGRMAAYVERFGDDPAPADHVPAVLDVRELGWKGQPTFLFDSRAVSSLASKSDFDDDLGWHVSMIAGGAARVSHGQFVSKAWWDALRWAAEAPGEPSAEPLDPARLHPLLAAVLEGEPPSRERWLFVDEPETAIDAETLLLGLAALLEIAEIGRLRVFCASHSLLFAAGVAGHPKVQVVDLGRGRGWLWTQDAALRLAADLEKLADVGRDIASKLAPPAAPKSRKGRVTRKPPVKRRGKILER